MSDLLAKPIDAISGDDLDELCSLRLPESETLEFKAAVPAKAGTSPWSAGSRSLSDYSKREIVSEVVALANSYGGNLLIGIDETDENPPRAKSVRPVDSCGELETRLEQVLRDLIEPVIAGLQVRSIPCPKAEDGVGAVVVRVPPSRLGPHRSKADFQVYARIGRSAIPLSMLEIQDRAYNARVALERLEQKLDARSVSTQPLLGSIPATVVIRATAVPLASSIVLPRPYEYNEPELPLPVLFVAARVNEFSVDFSIPYYDPQMMEMVDPWLPRPLARKPMLRGARFECTI